MWQVSRQNWQAEASGQSHVSEKMDDFKAVADQIRQTMKAEPNLTRWGHFVSLTASFGVASFADDASDIEELPAYADQVMFHGKMPAKTPFTPRQRSTPNFIGPIEI